MSPYPEYRPDQDIDDGATRARFAAAPSQPVPEPPPTDDWVCKAHHEFRCPECLPDDVPSPPTEQDFEKLLAAFELAAIDFGEAVVEEMNAKEAAMDAAKRELAAFVASQLARIRQLAQFATDIYKESVARIRQAEQERDWSQKRFDWYAGQLTAANERIRQTDLECKVARDVAKNRAEEVNRLRERIRQLEADARRLDAVESLVRTKRLGFDGRYFYTFPITPLTKWHPTLREAIDAAIPVAPQKTQEPAK